MNLIRRWLKTKSVEINDLGPVNAPDAEVKASLQRVRLVTLLEESYNTPDIGDNFMDMFCSIPEVFWPIDYIAKRISESHFDIKRIKDDSIVMCDRTGAAQIINQPNPITTWRELLYQHFVYKFATGNAYLRAVIAESLSDDQSIFRWCSNYWALPADKVEIVPCRSRGNVPLFGIAELDEIIEGYRLHVGDYSSRIIPPRQIWHDKDCIPMRIGTRPYLESESRLKSVKRNIANLIAVYEARNVIYRKRGAVGFLVSQKEDESGTVALDPEEKKELRKELDKNYGIGEGQSPYGITDVPVSFVRTNLSISELQPFEETLEDAVKIAAIFGIPSVLVPRKDQSTFSNQDAAEKSVYTSVIIPAAKRFCRDLTHFLGLDRNGYYIDCDFSDVACLQVGLKEATEVDKLTNEVCLVQFNSGLITINDWRARMHMQPLDGEIYDKVKFEMTPQELELVDKIIKSQKTSKGEAKNGNSNQMPSDEDE